MVILSLMHIKRSVSTCCIMCLYANRGGALLSNNIPARKQTLVAAPVTITWLQTNRVQMEFKTGGGNLETVCSLSLELHTERNIPFFIALNTDDSFIPSKYIMSRVTVRLFLGTVKVFSLPAN